MTYELEFSTADEQDEFFAALSFAKMPGKPLYSHASQGYDDHGRETVTFARRCYSALGEPIKWYFAEQVVR